MLLLFFTYGCSNLSDTPEIKIDLVNTDCTQAEITLIHQVADYELEFYRIVFSGKIPEIRIKIFGDPQEYANFQKKISSSKASNGFYSLSKKLIVVYKNERYLKTVAHEINHFMMRHFIIDVPKWINEGLSEYFEFAQKENGKIIIRHQNAKLRRLAAWVHDKNKIDLNDFFTWTNKKWRDFNQNSDYYSSTISWGLICFFMKDDVNRNFLLELLRNLKDGTDDYEFLEKFYPGGIRKLQIDFFVYIDLVLSENLAD